MYAAGRADEGNEADSASSLVSFGPVAQRIEQRFPKPLAACSTHAGVTEKQWLVVSDQRGEGQLA